MESQQRQTFFTSKSPVNQKQGSESSKSKKLCSNFKSSGIQDFINCGRIEFQSEPNSRSESNFSENNTGSIDVKSSQINFNSSKSRISKIRIRSRIISTTFLPLLVLVILSLQVSITAAAPSRSISTNSAISSRHHDLSRHYSYTNTHRRDQVHFGFGEHEQFNGNSLLDLKGKGKAKDEDDQQQAALEFLNGFAGRPNDDNTRVKTVGESSSNSDSDSDDGERPSKRWGHSSTFLNGTIQDKQSQLLFIGGQVDRSGQITNDVWSLDITALTNPSPSSSNSTSDSNRWSRLSSSNLPPHSFSSSVLLPKTHAAKREEDELWLIGGLTLDCSKDSPIHVWKNSTGWKSPGSIEEAPLRRKGAVGFNVPANLGKQKNSNNTTDGQIKMNGVMVLGGVSDSSTCYSSTNSTTNEKSPKEVNYFGLDIWSQKSSTSTKSNASSITPTSRSLSLDSRMKSLSLVDSSSVLIPVHQSSSSKSPSHDPRIAFMGGKQLDGQLAEFNNFWVLELSTGNWEKWITIPSNSTEASKTYPKGRTGHSTSMTKDSKIVMFGGYLNESTKPSNEIWVLDIKENPAQWSKLEFEDEKVQARAGHTVNMIEEVMIVGFGDDGKDEKLSQRGIHQDHMSFLDTSESDPKNWKWSSSVDGVLESRKAKVSFSRLEEKARRTSNT